MKIIIASAGGGHFSPVLSVIKRLSKAEVIVIGRKYGIEGDRTAESLEYKICKSLDLRFISLTTGRLQRKFTKYTLLSLAKIPFGIIQSFTFLIKEKPDIVLSFGGYIGIPVVVSAWLLNIPVIIHEQALTIGLGNKFAAIFAKKVCISWETSLPFFPNKKTVLTGNPIKDEFINLDVDNINPVKFGFKSKNPLLYITGGSIGSHSINNLVEKSLPDLLQSCNVLHQTGDATEFNDFNRLIQLRKNLPENLRQNYIIKKFLTSKEAVEAITSANLVISRAGIGTITELLYIGVPSIILPIQDNLEQEANAVFIEEKGSAEIIRSINATSQNFIEVVNKMILNESKYRNMAQKNKKLIKKDSADKIVAVLQDYLK